MGSVKKQHKDGRSNRFYSSGDEFEFRYLNKQKEISLFKNNRLFKYLISSDNQGVDIDELNSKITNLEDNETIFQIYEFIGQSSSGTLTIPEKAAVFDVYGDGVVDAVMVEADENNVPVDTNSVNSSGDSILIQSIGATGNWSTINGVPTKDSCIVYFIVIKDEFKSNVPLESQTAPGIKGLLAVAVNSTLQGDGRLTTPLKIAGLDAIDTGEPGQAITINNDKTAFKYSGAISSNPIQLKAISQLDQPIAVSPLTTIIEAEVTQESNGITITNGVIEINKDGFFRIQVQLNFNNANNTHLDTWAEYWDGDSWDILPDSGNHYLAANANIGQFLIESTFSVVAGTQLRLIASTDSGTATLSYTTDANGTGTPSVTFIAYELNPIVIGINKETNNLTEDFHIGQQANGNSTIFEPNGTAVAQGEATCWDEVSQSLFGQNIFVSAGRIDYNYTNLTVDYSENARYPEEFSGTVLQMPHRRASNTNIRPHVHWVQNENSNPNILIEYRTCNNGEVFSAWTLKALTASDNLFAFTTLGMQQITEFNLPTAVGESLGISGTFECRIYRDSNNTSGLFAGPDTYNGNFEIKYYDIHFLVDMHGSREEFIK